jgi:hypothetical protein
MTKANEASLRQVVEDAYRVFSPYLPHPSTQLTVCYCNCCMTRETEAALRKTPLRSLTTELLSEYTNSAHGWDDDYISREFRYFLPRYMDLMASGEIPCYNGLECTFSRLQGVNWRATWPADEVRVLDGFFDALLLQTLTNVRLVDWPAGWFLETDISDILVLVVLANGDLERVLAVWDAAPDPSGAIHMAASRSNIGWRDGAQRHISAFLDSYPEAAQLIARFLLRPEVDQRLENAFFAIDDPRLQKIVSDATSF